MSLITSLLEIEVPQAPEGADPIPEAETVEFVVDNILDLRNGALSKFITVTDDGVSLTTDFQTLLRQLLDTAQGLMGSLTSYDTVEKWDAEGVAQLTEPQMLAYLVRTLLTSMIDYMDIPKTMPQRNEKTGIVTEVPINGYGLATYALINIMADKMPEKDYYGMIENYKNGDPGEKLNPGFVPGKFEEPAAFTVLADYMYYFLNAKTTMAIPAGLTFDETLQWISPDDAHDAEHGRVEEHGHPAVEQCPQHHLAARRLRFVLQGQQRQIYRQRDAFDVAG